MSPVTLITKRGTMHCTPTQMVSSTCMTDSVLCYPKLDLSFLFPSSFWPLVWFPEYASFRNQGIRSVWFDGNFYEAIGQESRRNSGGMLSWWTGESRMGRHWSVYVIFLSYAVSAHMIYVLANFTILCTLVADLSNVPLSPKRNSKGETYYIVTFDIVMNFGLTELQAQLRWLENVSRQPSFR